MRRLRDGLVRSDVLRLSACLVALGVAGVLGGCAGDPGDRVYGFQALASAAQGAFPGSRLSRAQEEAIIAQAIVAHEMRRP